MSTVNGVTRGKPIVQQAQRESNGILVLVCEFFGKAMHYHV